MSLTFGMAIGISAGFIIGLVAVGLVFIVRGSKRDTRDIKEGGPF